MSEQWIEAHDLYRRSEALGVTERKLEEWRLEGLLPPSRKVGRGRGRGFKFIYPATTLEQLTSIVSLRKRGVRTYGKLRLLLWLEGHRIDLGAVKAEILSALTLKEALREDEEIDDFISRLAVETEPSLRSRKVVWFDRRNLANQADRQSFISYILQELLGQSYLKMNEQVDDNKPTTYGELMERGWGLHRLRNVRLGRHGTPLVTGEFGSLVEQIVPLFDLENLRKVIEAASDDEMEQARLDLHLVIGILSGITKLLPLLGISERYLPLKKLLSFFSPPKLSILACYLIPVFLIARRDKLNLLDTALVRQLLVLVKLKEEIPVFASLLSWEGLQATLDNPERMRAFEQEAQRLVAQHREEIRAFKRRYPTIW